MLMPLVEFGGGITDYLQHFFDKGVMCMKLFAVITGNIRSPEYTKLVIDYLKMYKDRNVIDSVVFSTWDGEIDKLDGLREALGEMDCILVESEMPRIIQKNVATSYTSSIFQYMAMYNASLVIPDDVMVLKTRTDRCMETNVKMFRYLESVSELDSISNFFSVFQYSTRVPFCFEDITFLANIANFRGMLDFGIQNFVIEQNPAAQVSFFGSDLKLLDPVVSLTLDCFSFSKFRKLNSKDLLRVIENRDCLEALVRFYYRYYEIVNKRFIDVESNARLGVQMPPVSSIIGIGEEAFSYRGFDPFNECLSTSNIDQDIFAIVEKVESEENSFDLLFEHYSALERHFKTLGLFRESVKISKTGVDDCGGSRWRSESNLSIIEDLISSGDSERLHAIIRDKAKLLIDGGDISNAWMVLKSGIYDGDFVALEMAAKLHLEGHLGNKDEMIEFCRYFNKSGTAEKSKKLIEILEQH